LLSRSIDQAAPGASIVDIDLIIIALIIPAAAIFLFERFIAGPVVKEALETAAAEYRALQDGGAQWGRSRLPYSS
jgi:hypothetical protein